MAQSVMIPDVFEATLMNPDLRHRKRNRTLVYESEFSYFDHTIAVQKTGSVCALVGSRCQGGSAYLREEWKKEC
ncbi:hypothetical protein TZ00_12225 [Agreia bicolorata]|uniref:Uncharacterized protein n=1 Tax=Agreia bicolorata TaxID=110935 RepID=A0ABR5CDS5_9MICO|nr:hypothetical protein TZ00_12225 [Agreia bicolorata]